MNKIWMIYLFIGLIVLSGLVLQSYAKERKSKWAKVVMRSLNEDENGKLPFLYDFKVVIAPVIAGVFVWLFWPLALIYTIYLEYSNFKEKKKIEIELNEPKFDCQPEFLINKISLESAEKIGIIYDPKKLTPDVPFGFLYEAWVDFCSKVETSDEVWTFLIPKGTFTAESFQTLNGDMRGFAILRKGKIVSEFIYEMS
jgi:hypothetical protein